VLSKSELASDQLPRLDGSVGPVNFGLEGQAMQMPEDAIGSSLAQPELLLTPSTSMIGTGIARRRIVVR
jgi:hypothetical protein